MRVRVALVGAGLVGQAAHAQTLWEERDRFELVAVADPSHEVRSAVAARYGIPHHAAILEDLLPAGLDAIVCAAPDAVHEEIAIGALRAGLHVFCEKPLALSVSACDAIIAAAERAERIVQVGYMKLHDPAFAAFLDRLPPGIDDLRFLSVEVNDPDQAPFVAHLPMVTGGDVPADLIADTRRRTRAAVAAAAGRHVDGRDLKAFEGYLSAMVHDLSLVHAVLARLGQRLPAPLAEAASWAEGRGVSLALELAGGGRATLSHLNLPGVADYTERMTAFCRDRILELTFPSPYLRHHPTRLVEKRGDGAGPALEVLETRASYEEAFREELRRFHASVTEGAPVVGDAAGARLDVAVLLEAFGRAARSRPAPNGNAAP